ncbi:DoxX family protein [Mucilaginibacter sp. BJC16-A38]|uniref:DoxX family protein n=1 Tax=Mucilaginibacter phenanthrenivorans TaxID=1234842 RepID=UPI00215840A7|nr:DoxX family protein [Mucilaginibacter phenanthrenivorans]MCR8556711.1 DoxX family protein [Mucilaginibacter phenanthrenivorans]
METGNSTPSKASLCIGWIISGLCILFFLFDSITKIIKEEHSVKGSVQLGWPEHAIQGIGIALLISTILYLIPRTSILGAILLTGYLGGAIAIMIRAEQQLYFASVFGLLVWLGLYLRIPELHKILPIRKQD